MTLIHDGECQEFTALMSERNYRHPSINFFCTKSRYNDYGHTLRDQGLKQATGTYTILTNADNYFIPKAVEMIQEKIAVVGTGGGQGDPDIVIFDMIHSHDFLQWGGRSAYGYFCVDFAPYKIDVSAAAVKTTIAKSVGFRDKHAEGDQTYFQDIKDKYPALTIAKIDAVLFVHN